jgi:hypothetical protein
MGDSAVDAKFPVPVLVGTRLKVDHSDLDSILRSNVRSDIKPQRRRVQTERLIFASSVSLRLICFGPEPMKPLLLIFLVFTPVALGQNYPKEIRGYKVERAVVEVKKTDKNDEVENDLVKFGDPTVVSASPLGIRLEIPVVVAPVKQKGKVDFLVFEKMVINGTSVEIEDYRHKFKLPTKERLVLKDPLRLYIFLPNAILAALGEWSDSKENWLVTGRIYVFGEFKKLLFNFKRCIPIELNLTMRNPLRN